MIAALATRGERPWAVISVGWVRLEDSVISS